METSDLSQRARDLVSGRMSRLVRPQRPVRQIAALWFAAGITVAAVVGFFFDSKQGDARRHMAYDKVRAKGRDLGRWGGKKGRHLRNQAMGTVAEMKRKTDDTPSESTAGTGS